MNKEDLETLEDLKNIFIHLKNYGWVNDIKKEVVADKVIQAIENLIARNKELEKQMGKDLDVVYLQGVYNERDRWKSKVRELYEHYKDTGYYELESVLEELLQEGDK